MTRGRQSQKSGDASLNIQAQGDVTLGPNYLEVRQIAMDVFEANFLRLKEEAAKLAYQRAEWFITAFLREAARNGLTEIPEAKNPDFQYALFSGQREYARSGDADLGELLVQLLVDRARVDQRDLEQIVLNESLMLVPKLTPDQLDALSLIFILKYDVLPRVESLADFHRVLDDLVLPFVTGASRALVPGGFTFPLEGDNIVDLPSGKESGYQHLVYLGCIVNGGYEVKYGSESDSLAPFFDRYPGLFIKAIPRDSLLRKFNLTSEQTAHLFIPSRYKIDSSRPGIAEKNYVQLNAIDGEALDELTERLGVDPDSASRMHSMLDTDPSWRKEKLLSDREVMYEDLFEIEARPKIAQHNYMWHESPIRFLTLTSVGIAIAHANVKRRSGYHFDLTKWI